MTICLYMSQIYIIFFRIYCNLYKFTFSKTFLAMGIFSLTYKPLLRNIQKKSFVPI